ncbi:MAG: hypothetical protein WD601_07225 [Pseudohongiellaceae bacterium]
MSKRENALRNGSWLGSLTIVTRNDNLYDIFQVAKRLFETK